jgi:hypothetical protein
VLILLCFFRRFSVFERGFGVRHQHIRMTLFAVVDRFLGVADRLGQMILGKRDAGRYEGRDAKTQRECENSTVH